MNWGWAAAAPAVIAGVLWATGRVWAAILAYHVVCASAVFVHRARIRPLFRTEVSTWRWALLTTAAIVGGLALGPLLRDPSPYRRVFLDQVLPWGRSSFTIFAAYSLLIHAPLEEIFWRAAVLDPERRPLKSGVSGNALFFYLVHAAPMALLLGAEGWLLALPTALAGALWAFVQIRSCSLWPGLVSHVAADAAILCGMWVYWVR